MGSKTSKNKISPLEDISEEKPKNKNINKDNDGGEITHTLIEKEINNDPAKIEQMKQQLNSNKLEHNINNFLKSSIDNDPKIMNVSNENELRQEYKIEINKYHHKVNNRKVKVPQKSKNYISTSKYTWYNFAPKILYEQFTKMSNIYFIIIAILQCFPEISNANGKPIILMPLCIVVIVNSIKDFYEDWKRKKSDDEENNRKVEVYDLDMEKFVIKKWKDVFVGNIIKVKKGEYFPADCVLISSTDRKTHGCYIETKNLDGETNLKLKKSVTKFVNRCKELNTFQGKFITQLPNEFIYQFSGVFEFDYNDNFHSLSNLAENNQKHIDETEKIKDKNGRLHDLISEDIEEKLDNDPKDNIKDEEKIDDENNIDNENNLKINNHIKKSLKLEKEDIETEYEGNISEHTYYTRRLNSEGDTSFATLSNINEDKTVIVDNNNFLLRGCSLRQTESVLCFVVYAGKNTKIMQNSPGARAKTSSVEKRMNHQIKFIFFLQILLGLLASIFSLSEIISLGKDPAPYIYKDKNDRPFDFEEYASKFNRIISNENFNKIFGKNNESLFSMLKKFFKEIAPLFDLDVISFLLIKLGTWCVLLNNLVPISLLMTLELVKYFQGFFISWDIDIYDQRQRVTTKVQTSTLNEELGQIKYIFSDKTGTLTKNFMKFKRVSIGLKQYNENKENEFEHDVNENENNIYEFKSGTNLTMESNGQENLNQNKNDAKIINKEDIKKKKKEKNRDEYGRIRHVEFDDDKDLIKDLGIVSLMNSQSNNNIENDNNAPKDEKNIKEEIISTKSEVEDDKKTELIDRESNAYEEEISKEKTENTEEEKDDDEIEKNPDVNQKEMLDLFMTALATCHSGVVEEKEFILNKKLIYQASSPDEVAILNFARKYKYIFLGRKDNNKIIIKKPCNSDLSEIIFKIPFLFEYSSERKSMSVVLQNITNPEEIYLFMKGADNVILQKLDKNNKINKAVMKNLKNALDSYAKEGLRILAVAYKKLTIEEMNKYQKEFFKASKSTYNKKEKIEQLAKFVETDLIFLGVTAIEDELQDNVNETLKDFSEAGIKLWVLTGDKKDTAKSIAYSCGLFDDEKFNIFEINEGLSKTQLESRLNELVEQFNNLVDKMDMGNSKQIKFLSSNKMDLENNNKQNSDNNNQNKNDNINNINMNAKIEDKKINDNNLNDDKKENEENIENIKDENGKKEEKDNIQNNEDEKEKKIENNAHDEIKKEELIDEDKNINENNNKNNKKENDNINSQNNEKVDDNKESEIHNEVINEKSENNIKPKFALVISSDELNILSLNYELEILFYELSSRCNSVLCCRVSPIQKAKMVHLIQRFTKLQEKKGSNYYKYLSEKQNEFNNTQIVQNTRDKDNKPMSPLKDSVITLAIGDGANDVNMITSAHVGVGIIGVEGKQAARASDYAIGQFKFLKKILFYHGHESLRRNSYIIYYNFYKNFLFVMPQFYVGFYSLFSGQSVYDPWLYQLFNILFSVLPILWFGIYDSERTTTVAMSNAKFYTSMNQKLYNNWNFWRWIFQGILQGLAIFIFVFSSNNIYANNNSGEIQDFKSSGMMTYSLVVITVNLKVFQLTSVHGAVSLFFLVFSIGSYYILTFLMSNEPSMFYFGVFWRMIKNVRYFFILGLLCIGVTAISAGLFYLSKICYKYEESKKHDKIMYKYYKNLENDKKIKKNKNKKKQVKKKSKIKDKKVKKELIEEDNPYH